MIIFPYGRKPPVAFCTIGCYADTDDWSRTSTWLILAQGLPSRNLGLRFIEIHSFPFPSAAGLETHKFKEVRGEGWHVFFHKPLKERMLVSRKNGVGTQREAESSIRLQVPGCSTFLGSSGILAFGLHYTQIIFKQYLLLA